MNRGFRKNVSPQQLLAVPFNPRDVVAFSKQAGRLAFRHEGDFWNCYYALPDTMEGAIFLSSTRLGNTHSEKLKKLFMDYNRSIINAIMGDRVEFK